MPLFFNFFVFVFTFLTEEEVHAPIHPCSATNTHADIRHAAEEFKKAVSGYFLLRAED